MGSRKRKVSQKQLETAKEVLNDFRADSNVDSKNSAAQPAISKTDSLDTQSAKFEVEEGISALDFSRQLLAAQQRIKATETIRNGLDAERPGFKGLLRRAANGEKTKGFLSR